jgi:PPK2 family polyphosphate:nucleotide phosphotransferase
MNFQHKLMTAAGRRVVLSQYDPDATFGYKKGQKLKSKLEELIGRLDNLQYLLYAENKRALLIILQGIDASGKDGTVRHVMSGLNPQGTRVTAFKEPSAEEASHDFLWRVHAAVPRRGDVGIFNRSHYEDVLVARVHGLVPESVWSRRYDQINRFESYLTANQVTVVKFFLHISRAEQKRRLQERIDDPTKRWKVSESDFKERLLWQDYTRAYEAVLTRCNTRVAPWYIIPANHKWFRNFAVSHILVEILEGMHLKYPKPRIDLSKLKLQ